MLLCYFVPPADVTCWNLAVSHICFEFFYCRFLIWCLKIHFSNSWMSVIQSVKLNDWGVCVCVCVWMHSLPSAGCLCDSLGQRAWNVDHWDLMAGRSHCCVCGPLPTIPYSCCGLCTGSSLPPAPKTTETKLFVLVWRRRIYFSICNTTVQTFSLLQVKLLLLPEKCIQFESSRLKFSYVPMKSW